MTLHKKHGICVDLDALLDTRAGTLHILDPSLFGVAITEGYLDREEDAFPYVSKEEFAELYALRDREVLINSPKTGVFNLILQIVKDAMKDSIDKPWHAGCKLYVNIHPYQLTNTEAAKFVAVFKDHTKGFIDIEIIDKSKEQLTPQYCKENFTTMIKYEYASWLDYLAQNKSIKAMPLTDITLVVPELYFAKKPSAEEMAQLKKDKLTPFKATEVMLSPFITFKPLHVSYFCVEITAK